MKQRYHRRSRRAGSLPPLAIAGICVAAAILLTVLIGNLLTLWLNDETYNRLTAGEEETQAPTEIHKTNLPDINAYPHMLGNDPSSALGYPAISISINKPDGNLNYCSEVSAYQNLTENQSVPLAESMQTLSAYTPYISGVFYPQSFAYATEDLRFASAAAESALLREFVRNGGKEIVLASLPFENVSQGEIIEYIKAVKTAVGTRGVGVAVPLSVAQSNTGWELLNALLKVCDFCLLDVTDITPGADGTLPSSSAILSSADYFLSQYDMRLMLTDLQTDLRAEAEARMISDYQIIKAPPLPAPDTEEAEGT